MKVSNIYLQYNIYIYIFKIDVGHLVIHYSKYPAVMPQLCQRWTTLAHDWKLSWYLKEPSGHHVLKTKLAIQPPVRFCTSQGRICPSITWHDVYPKNIMKRLRKTNLLGNFLSSVWQHLWDVAQAKRCPTPYLDIIGGQLAQKGIYMYVVVVLGQAQT